MLATKPTREELEKKNPFVERMLILLEQTFILSSFQRIENLFHYL